MHDFVRFATCAPSILRFRGASVPFQQVGCAHRLAALRPEGLLAPDRLGAAKQHRPPSNPVHGLAQWKAACTF